MKSFPRMLLSAFSSLAMLTGAAGAWAADDPCAFTGSGSGSLMLAGDARPAGPMDSLLQLTPNQINQVGWVFLTSAVEFSADTSFHTSFRAQFANIMGGEGISFTLLASLPPDPKMVSGTAGPGMGYGGLKPSVTIEFDTNLSSGTDPNGNHIALMEDGDPAMHRMAKSPSFLLTNETGFRAWIDYDGKTKQIQVFTAQDDVKPQDPLVSDTIDIFAKLGPKVFFGFTSATSANFTNAHNILEWEFSTQGVPCACKNEGDAGPGAGADAACGVETPVCSPTQNICVECSAANAEACKGKTSNCDEATGKCVECLNNADCSGNTPTCDPMTKACRPCTDNAADCDEATPVCQPSGACAPAGSGGGPDAGVDDGLVLEGSGCACGVASDEEEKRSVLWAAAVLALAAAWRQKKR